MTELNDQPLANDPVRVRALACARRFKRSWVEMASVLVEIRDTGRHREWGFEDFFDYCAQELAIKQKTAEKLTLSYTTLRRHAPRLLDDESTATIPSQQSVDYYARAMASFADDEAPIAAAPPELTLLHRKVFTDARPVSELRKEFDGSLFPRPAEDAERDELLRLRRTAQRLLGLVTGSSLVSKATGTQNESALSNLITELDGRIERLRTKAA